MLILKVAQKDILRRLAENDIRTSSIKSIGDSRTVNPLIRRGLIATSGSGKSVLVYLTKAGRELVESKTFNRVNVQMAHYYELA